MLDNNEKKALALALTSALVAPQAFAAQDTAGMHYTSAAEGFYASIRVQYASGGDNDSDIQDAASRVGVRGTNDLGGGLEGFYLWETGVGITDNALSEVRISHVGLRGSFGSVAIGSMWNHMYNRTYGTTDVANWASGNLAYGGSFLPHARTNGTSSDRTGGDETREDVIGDGGVSGSIGGASVEYNTPELNGLSAGFHVASQSGDENDIDTWGLSADYAVGGFSVAAAYYNDVDGFTVTPAVVDNPTTPEDETAAASRLTRPMRTPSTRC